MTAAQAVTVTRRSIVVLRALGLGDLLTGVPALRGLRRVFPQHRLLLAAPPCLREAAAAIGVVDGLLPAQAPDRAVPERIPWTGPPPERAIDLHGCGPESTRPLRALRPWRLHAYAQRCGPAWQPDEHEPDRWCRLLTWYGIRADPAELRIAAPPAASPAPGAVVLHPGAEAAARRWPAERFAAVGRELAADGREVVVTAGPREGGLAHRVAADAGLRRSAVRGAPDGLRFPDLAALVAQASAVVVGDTGIAHLATALATPSVVLFGPVSPRLWGPPPCPRHRALWRPDSDFDSPDVLRPGDAHGPTPDPRLLRIQPPEVLAALADVLTPAPAS